MMIMIIIMMMMMVIIIIIIIIIEKTDKWYTHMPKPVYETGMSQCCGIKQYTETEKLQQIGQI